MLRTQEEDEAKDWVSSIQKAILSAEEQAELDLHKSKVCALHSVLGLAMTPALTRTCADKTAACFPVACACATLMHADRVCVSLCVSGDDLVRL